MNFASATVLVISPVSPLFEVVKSLLRVSTTLYVIPDGRPSAVFDSPPFRVTVASPELNSISPYVPVIVLSLSEILNSNS